MSLSALEKRIEELEAQAAFQDELHHQLNDIVARQDREILELKAQLKELATQLAETRDASTAAVVNPADEVPPHY